MMRLERCRAAAAHRATPARASRRLASIAWRTLVPMVLAAPLCLAPAASARPGAIARARLERTVVSVDAAPCNRARLLRTASGAVYETEPAAQLTPGIRIRVSGTIYPQASICKLYPWLRLDPDAPLPFGPATALDVRLSRSIPAALQQAAARAVASAESGAPGIAASLAELPQIEIVAAPAALRSLLDTLRLWSHASQWWPWRSSRSWSRYWSRQQLRAGSENLADNLAENLADDRAGDLSGDLVQRQPGNVPADSTRATDEDR